MQYDSWTRVKCVKSEIKSFHFLEHVVVIIPHGLPLLVVKQHVRPHFLHPLDGHLRCPIFSLVSGHQVTANQSCTPNIMAQFVIVSKILS